MGIASSLVAIALITYFFRLDMLKTNGTAKIIIFANNLTATIVYGLYKNVDYSLAVPILIPVVVGSWLGAKTAVKIGSQKLKIVFQIISALTILKLLNGVL